MKMIVANWKMNGSPKLAQQYIDAFRGVSIDGEIVICPPFELLNLLINQPFALGAQDCYSFESGAYTGEVSPLSLKNLGCKYVILGHSERRMLMHESNQLIFDKLHAAKKVGLKPILCVGETDNSRRQEELLDQLSLFRDIDNIIVAYEPVWCIGTGITPQCDDISNAINLIKTFTNASMCLYGGSINENNYQAILNTSGVDGLLIGGTSLNVEAFMKICAAEIF